PPCPSIDDFNNPVSTGIDQYGPIIDYGVAIFGNAILPWDLIVGHAARRQIGANAEIVLITVRGMPLTSHISAKSRSRFISNSAGHCADGCANSCPGRAANDSATDCA